MSAPAVLLLPRRTLARGFGGAAPAIGTACTNIQYLWAGTPAIFPVQITAPGNYCLTADQSSSEIRIDTAIPNCTIDCNGHTVTGNLMIRNYNSLPVASGLVVKNLVVNGPVNVTGNTSATQAIPPIVTLEDISFITSSARGYIYESNITMRRVSIGWGVPGCVDDWATIQTLADHGTPAAWNYWHVYDSCKWGYCTELGIEGVGDGWKYCTFINCETPAASGVGGWYNNPCCGAGYAFQIQNCTFTGNTIRNFFFAPPGGGGPVYGTSDINSNFTWPLNTFTSNTYTA